MITLADIKGAWRSILLVVVVLVVAVLCVLLANSRTDLGKVRSDNHVLRNDNALQGQVIATQTFNFNRFNQAARETGRLNSLIDGRTEKTVIEYREILRREKTCNLPVPADIAGGLLEYTNSLRAGAMHTDSSRLNETDSSSAASSELTYCQAALWINPLLAAIEKANNQLAAIRDIEKTRVLQ